MNSMLTAEERELLAELRGFFHAFEWVNSKTNHGYSFNVEIFPQPHDLDEFLQKQFSPWNPTKIERIVITDWQGELNKTITRWLLAYLRDHKSIGRLEDTRDTFTLSIRSQWKYLVAEVQEILMKLCSVDSAFAVEIETDEFYACEWRDLFLIGSRRIVHLHFDVSD